MKLANARIGTGGFYRETTPVWRRQMDKINMRDAAGSAEEEFQQLTTKGL